MGWEAIFVELGRGKGVPVTSKIQNQKSKINFKQHFVSRRNSISNRIASRNKIHLSNSFCLEPNFVSNFLGSILLFPITIPIPIHHLQKISLYFQFLTISNIMPRKTHQQTKWAEKYERKKEKERLKVRLFSCSFPNIRTPSNRIFQIEGSAAVITQGSEGFSLPAVDKQEEEVRQREVSDCEGFLWLWEYFC
jgi:hypothetical protein